MAAAFICAMWLVSNALSDSKRFEVAWRSGSASGSKGGSMGATTMGGLDRCIRLAFWQFAHTHTHIQNVHKLYGQKFEATQEAEKERQREWARKRENDAAAAEKTKIIIQKLKLEELKWGVVCCCRCCCVGQLNLPRFFFSPFLCSIKQRHVQQICDLHATSFCCGFLLNQLPPRTVLARD